MITVTVGIIEKDGKILIARRNKNDLLKGKWEFPGGRLEPGETPEVCLKRELREELGIDTLIGELVGSYKHRYEHISVELMAFRVKEYIGGINPIVYEEIRWVAPSELPVYDFPDANKPIVEALIRK
jgi:8-oxo-dGTP diphosphatase